MQVTGYIGGLVEERQTKGGRRYFAFRLAENFGREPHKETVWFDVAAFISTADGDKLARGMRVKVQGKLATSAFTRRDGSLAVSNKILAFSTEAV